jgi:hypothetical protein
MQKKLKSDFVKKLTPKKLSKNNDNFYPVKEVPYLETLVSEARKKMSTQDLFDEWDAFIEKKSKKTKPSEAEEVDLSDALLIMFNNFSYNEVKRHYAAFIFFVNHR